jgi:glycosyltransferase involved in cell wall biosynthesis
MSVLFCHDHRFIVGADGALYSRGQFSGAIVARYERIFRELFIAARTLSVDEPADPTRYNLVADDVSRFVALPNLSSPRALLFGNPDAKRMLERAVERADAVIVRLPSEIGLLAADIADALGKPMIVEVVGCARDGLVSHGRPEARLYAPIAQRRMRRVVARSAWTLYVTSRFLQSRYPSSGDSVCASNVQLPPHDEAVLARRLDKVARDGGPLVFGMVAALFHREKRVDVAIRALASAVRAGLDAELHVAGPGDTSDLAHLAADLGIESRVRFVGFIPHGDPLFSYLDGLDAYVQTSFQEGLPRGLIEAMSRALPAVGSDIGGTDELLADQWLHRPGDSATLARQMAAFADPALRAGLAAELFARAADFTPEVLDARRAAFWRRFCAANGIEARNTVPSDERMLERTGAR